MEEVYRSDTLLVRCIPAEDRSRWVVTFDHYGGGSGFDRRGFGEQFLAQAGISQLNILGSGNHWYQYPDIELALATARASMAGARRIVTYGSSMGGYAAIRFAEQLGAHACLALSPQYSNDPRKVPFEGRWRNDAYAIAWMAELDGPIRPGVRTVIMTDARGEDAEHARLIAGEIPVDLVSWAYAGHPVGTFLGSVGLLRRAVMDLVEDRFDPVAFGLEAEARRRESPVYLGELARLQPPWRSRTGIALARQALARAAEDALAHHTLAKKLTDAGEHEEALPLHARAVELGKGFSGYGLPYSEALAKAGRIEQALAVALELVDREPGSAALQSWLGQVHWTMGRREEARHHATLARDLAPSNHFYAGTLALYVRRSRSRLRRVGGALLRRLRMRRRP